MITTRRKFTAAASALFTVGYLKGARGDGLAQPTGKPVLTISGKISIYNKGNTAVFDLPMLEALGSDTIRTRTPWYDHVVVFQGVLMRTLLHTVGATGTNVQVIALNDYFCDIPVSDFSEFPVLLAYDTDTALQSQKYYSRSSWQVAKIQVQ